MEKLSDARNAARAAKSAEKAGETISDVRRAEKAAEGATDAGKLDGTADAGYGADTGRKPKRDVEETRSTTRGSESADDPSHTAKPLYHAEYSSTEAFDLIRNEPVEHAVVLNADGSPRWSGTNGNPTSVKVPTNQAKGGRVYHNHPRAADGSLAGGFSGKDFVSAAVSRSLSENVTDGVYDYVLKPQSGKWPSPADMVRLLERRNEEITKALEHVGGMHYHELIRTMPHADAIKAAEEFAAGAGWHEALHRAHEVVAGEFGLDYRRIP